MPRIRRGFSAGDCAVAHVYSLAGDLPAESGRGMSMRAIFLSMVMGLATVSTDVFAHFAVEGSLEDIEAFVQEVRQAREKSRVFDDLIRRIDAFQQENKDFTMAIKVGRSITPMIAGGESQIIWLNKENSSLNTNLGFIEMHLTKLEYAVDLDDVEKFPVFERDPLSGKYRLPEGVPPWAISREAILAHELAELFDAYKNSYEYSRNHAAAVEIENEVRREFGQPGLRGESEDITLTTVGGKTITGVSIDIGGQHRVFIETRGNRNVVEIHYDPR